MNTNNINISNLKKHFFVATAKTQDGETNPKSKSKTTKLVHYDFTSKNEILVSDRIKEQIPNYRHYFCIMEECLPVNVAKLPTGRSIVSKLEDLNDNIFSPKFLLETFGVERRMEFHDFLFQLPLTPKSFLFRVIHSFSQLFDSISKLHKADICFFDLTPEHIVFCQKNNRMQLVGFQNSIYGPPADTDYMSDLLSNISSYTHKPLEVHILFYFVKNPSLQTISYSFIEEVSEVFVKNTHHVVSSPDYKNKCIETLKKFINQPREAIFSEILKNAKNWDIYGLCFIYLHIMCCFTRVFSLNEPSLNKWIQSLERNIQPGLRECGSDLLGIEGGEWDFVNRLDRTKMSEFIDIL
jgi:hypothetical protein